MKQPHKVARAAKSTSRATTTTPSPSVPPVIIERSDLDESLANCLRWDRGTNLITVQAVAKFKVFAGRAQIRLSSSEDGGTRTVSGLSDRSRRLNKLKELQGSKQLLEQRLNFLGLCSVNITGDGNCQFRALSHELFGTQVHHMYLRSIAVAWMHSHSSSFSPYIGSETDWTTYMRGMARTKTWADELTLRALCDALGVTIHIITSTKDNWHLLYTPQQHLHQDNVQEESNYTSSHRRHAFLSYISPVHYNAVRFL